MDLPEFELTVEDALKALSHLHSIRQAIGILGVRLNRCKYGSKKHQQYWNAMSKLEANAETCSATISMVLRMSK